VRSQTTNATRKWLPVCLRNQSACSYDGLSKLLRTEGNPKNLNFACHGYWNTINMAHQIAIRIQPGPFTLLGVQFQTKGHHLSSGSPILSTATQDCQQYHRHPCTLVEGRRLIDKRLEA